MRHAASALYLTLLALLPAALLACDDDQIGGITEDASDDTGDTPGELDTNDVPVCNDGAEESCDNGEGCPGTRTCVDGEWGACTFPAETCDGADNDCDGEVDEDFTELGDACSSGEGQCQVSGVIICGDDEASVVCSAIAGPDETEVCDGIDNDCDGTIDNVEGLGDSCTVGTGSCEASGTRVCDTEERLLVCDVSAGTPQAETCNGLDDDCDGTIDNVEGLGDSCAVGTGACRSSGERVCDLGSETLVCNATAGSPAAETCNDIDDNCDGTVDNVAGLGDSCTVGTGACQRNGSRICDLDSESVVCSASAGSPSSETCNGIDDDCDGTVDNVAGLGQACSVGTGACQRTGSRVCDTGSETLVCSVSAGSPSTESCNGIDDNCDGTVDNVAGLGQSCTVGVGACQRTGSRVCDTGSEALVCSASAGSPTTESCNGIDDNCDGSIDNVAGLGQSCTVGVGACQRTGSRICDTGSEALVCSVSVGNPTTESCNGIDDNCDGTVDNTTVSFAAAQSYGAAQGCIAMALGDIDGDGLLDVVCAPTLNSGSNPDTRIFTFLNEGSGTFGAANYLDPVALSPFRAQSEVALADLDGDGYLDIVVAGETMKIYVYLNDGSGNFATPYEAFDFAPPGEPGTGGLLLADINDDGHIDIATTIGTIRASDWNLAVSLGDGDGNFGPPSIIGGARPRARAILGRDLNNDGDLDLVVVSFDHVEIFRASSPANFGAPVTVLSGTTELGEDPLLMDLNGDSHEDLLLPAAGNRYFLPGTSTGFGSANSITVPGTEVSATAGQFDCDSSPETMTVAQNGGAPLYYLATPQNLSSVGLVASVSGHALRAADLDADGDTDIVVGDLSSGVRVFLRD